MRQYRQKKKLNAATDSTLNQPSTSIATPSKVFSSWCLYGKAMAKVKRSLPYSP